MFCELCNGLSIKLLIHLAEVEFHGRSFPQQTYYQHQPTYAKLVLSAQTGCSLCSLIQRGFQQVITPSSLSYWEGWTWDEVVSQVESQGEGSDIKICINADHLYSDEHLDRVELFDVLMIQAGTPEPIFTSEPSYRRDYIPPLKLSLSVSPGEPKRVGRYRVGRFQLDPALNSQHNYNVARRWIEECCTRHKKCSSQQVSKLPTRVIDVGSLDQQHDPRLILSGGLEARYITLSHCWGGEISPLLNEDTLIPFKDEIPLADLPANFRDAISVTREVGIRYLWIDSLCIIQDSPEDWEMESKMMGSIYKNSFLTISAAMSRRSTDGIFGTETDSVADESSMTLKLPGGDESNDGVEISLKDEDEENLAHLLAKSPLAERAWTLQEDILSPRILYYGQRQIYWKCPEGFQSADGVPPGTLMPEEDSHPAISGLLHSGLIGQSEAERRCILDDYYKLVQGYSSRKLTYSTDKLPAFSGVAAIIHPVVGGKYLAGIWSMDFRQGLLWFKEMGQCRHTLSDQAPSWSWAVTSDPIVFDFNPRKAVLSPYDANLLNCDVKLKTENLYGQVDEGRLVIDGFTKKLFRSRELVNFLGDGIARIHFDGPDSDNLTNTYSVFEFKSELGDYLLSIRRADSEEPIKELEVNDIDMNLVSGDEYLLLMIELIPSDFEGSTIISATCLVLMKNADGDEDKYIRVGILISLPRYKNKFEIWAETWERKIVTII